MVNCAFVMVSTEYVAMTTGASLSLSLEGNAAAGTLMRFIKSAMAFVRHRQGVGRVRHISCGLLWLQELVKGEVAGYSQQRHFEKHRRPQDKNPRKENNQSVVELDGVGNGISWIHLIQGGALQRCLLVCNQYFL